MSDSNSPAAAVFEPGCSPFRITSLGIVGDGELVRDRLWPAIRHNPGQLRIAVCGQRPASSLAGLPYRYCQILGDNLLPLAELYDDGFLSGSSAWYIATTSETHVAYALQLACLCSRVFVEKPIAAGAR